MKPSWKRIGTYAFDIAAVVAVIALRLSVWPRGIGEGPLPGAEILPHGWWWLGSEADLLLHGPDAGDWAMQARAVVEGDGFDNRRLPLYPHITALVYRIFPDFVFSGHVVNHVLSLGTALVTYLLGRLTSGRGPALMAAVLVAMNPYLIIDQQLFAVDPTFQFVCVLMAVAGIVAAEGARWGPVALGVTLGLGLSTHYLGLLFPALAIPLLIFRRDTWWYGPVALASAALPAALIFAWFIHGYPPITLAVIGVEYSVGVLSSVDRADLLGSGFGSVIPLVLERVPQALRAFYADVGGVMGPHGAGISGGLFALFVVGILGVGLPQGSKAWHRRWRWRVSVWFLLLMVPMLGLEAANAPERYEHYAWPIILLCIARGVASVAGLGDSLMRRVWRLWPREGLALVACGVAAAVAIPPAMGIIRAKPIGLPGMHERRVGMLVAENFPGRGPIVSWSQEVRFYSHRQGCKGFTCGGPTQDPRLSCSEHLSLECGGQGPLPYIIDEREHYGFADRPDVKMDAWVVENGEVVGVVEAEKRRTTVYRIPPELLPPPRALPALQPAPMGPPLR